MSIEPSDTPVPLVTIAREWGRIGLIVIILGLASLFLASNPPLWVLGVAGGLGAVVPAVAVNAAVGLVPASWKRTGGRRPKKVRWVLYMAVGAVAAAVAGAFVVVALVACGIIEVSLRPRTGASPKVLAVLPLSAVPAIGGLGALTWVAFKVGALSYGGGFVIIPLMQHDATAVYHWMTPAQFLNAVALGQVTPGPVVLTVAVVGYAAAGIGGGLLAAAVAFTPSFLFVVFGGSHVDRLRADPSIQSFLTGAGAAAIGAIAGASITLLRGLDVWWQFLLLGVAALWLLVLRRNVVGALLTAGVIGAVAVLAGAPIPR